MPLSNLRTIAIAAALCLAPSVSSAQEVFGTLDATLDGTENTWFLTAKDNDSQSFGLNMAVANLQSFSLWGQPTDQTVTSTTGSLLLTFDVMSVAGQVILVNASLTYFEDGWTSGWLANEADRITVSLSALEKTNTGVFLEGSFNAAAGFSEPLSSGQIDPARTMQIAGRFKATLPPSIVKDR